MAALNIIDAVISFIGLKLDLIQEANPLMGYIYNQHPFLFLLVKLSFSFLLYSFLYANKIPTKNIVKYTTYTAVVVYSFVFSLHIYWIVKI
ncbi:DUF5658 family protein [Heyndrickxia vini]|uniref:DUF5658 domain-containing protein n=1 Tax=Heyndrickxia vini TaxID=1476025 RepID=A0ABX7E6M7_9BACI|nr:DUF5658 family protein [Heyndrickxia vini]QQZ10955.1 hypothetical protein I5776_08745 [Heyndrickxia vini]